jgi:hypothetical protein
MTRGADCWLKNSGEIANSYNSWCQAPNDCQTYRLQPVELCPDGYQTVSELNDISGCGMEACGERYAVSSMDGCAEKCSGTEGCVAITWADVGEDRNHVAQQVCTLYSHATPNQMWGEQQVFCATEARLVPELDWSDHDAVMDAVAAGTWSAVQSATEESECPVGTVYFYCQQPGSSTDDYDYCGDNRSCPVNDVHDAPCCYCGGCMAPNGLA